MNQDSRLTQRLAEAQERHADAQQERQPLATVYRLYCEARGDIAGLVLHYFSAATLFYGVSIWQGKTEPSVTVEIIVDDGADCLQGICYLVGDIKNLLGHDAVLVTWAPVRSVVL